MVLPPRTACRLLASYEQQAAASAQQQEAEEREVGNYIILKTLGRGSFGRVVLAQHRTTGEQAAVKLLPRGEYVSPACLLASSRLSCMVAMVSWWRAAPCWHEQTQGSAACFCIRLHAAAACRCLPARLAARLQVRQYRTYVGREILHHASLRHPFVICISEVLLTGRWLAVVMEYAAGGDLYRHLLGRGGSGGSAGRRLGEGEARWMFQQLIIGLAYCHERVRPLRSMEGCRAAEAGAAGWRGQRWALPWAGLLTAAAATRPAACRLQGVANRDLKLENLLLEKEPEGVAGDWPLLKICDFGAPAGLLPALLPAGSWICGARVERAGRSRSSSRDAGGLRHVDAALMAS